MYNRDCDKFQKTVHRRLPVDEFFLIGIKSQYCIIHLKIVSRIDLMLIFLTTTKEAQKILIEVMDIPFILIVVMVSWVCTYVQAHQMAHTKYVHFSISIISQ